MRKRRGRNRKTVEGESWMKAGYQRMCQGGHGMRSGGRLDRLYKGKTIAINSPTAPLIRLLTPRTNHIYTPLTERASQAMYIHKHPAGASVSTPLQTQSASATRVCPFAMNSGLRPETRLTANPTEGRPEGQQNHLESRDVHA